MSMPLIFGVLTILGLGGAMWLSEHTVRQRVLKRMSSRAARTSGEFGRGLFPSELSPLAARIREILDRHLSVDLARLSPEDTFVDLEMAELDSMATVDFVIDLEREFGISISDRDAESMKTFNDVVKYVSAAIKQPMG